MKLCCIEYNIVFYNNNNRNKRQMIQEIEQEAQDEVEIGKLGEDRKEKLSLTQLIEQKLCVVFSVLNEEFSMSTGLACIFMSISFLQLFGLAFNENPDIAKVDLFYNDVASVLCNFRFYEIVTLAKNNSTLYFTIAYLLFFVHAAYLGLMLAVLRYDSSGKKEYGFLVHIECFLTPVLYWVLLSPTVEFFVSIFRCDLATGEHLVISGMVCWGSEHFIHVVLFCLFFVVNVIDIMLICRLGNECNPYNDQNPFRRFAWHFETMFALYRAIMSILCVLLSNSSMDVILDGVYLFCSIIMLLLYGTRALYYNKVVRGMFGACLLSSAWVYLNEFLFELADLTNVSYGGRTITTLIGMAAMYYISSLLRTAYENTLIKERTSVRLCDDTDVEIFLCKIIELEQGRDRGTLSEEEDTLLQGYIFVHKTECLKPECPMNTDEIFYVPQSKEMSNKQNQVFDDHVRVKHLIQKIYRDKMNSGGSKLRLTDSNEVVISSTRLLLACAYYQIYVLGNYYVANFHIDKAKTTDESLVTLCAVMKAKRVIGHLQEIAGRRKIHHGSEKLENFDLRMVLEYEAYFSRMKKKLLVVAERQKKLCAELLLPEPDLNNINQFGVQLIEDCDEAVAAWNQLRSMDCEDVKAEILYALYLTNVRSKQDEAGEHILMAKILGEKTIDASVKELTRNRQAMFTDDTAVVVMDTSSENRILKASNGVTRLFEYSQTDIAGKDVNILMPPFLGKEHAGFVERCLQTGKYNILNEVTETFGIDKERYVFPLYLCVRQYFDIVHGIIFLGLMKPSPKEEAAIITDTEGKILGVTYDVYEMMHEMTPTLLREQDVYMFYICPDFYREIGTRNYSDYVGALTLTFCVPKNLQAVSLTINTEHTLIASKVRKTSQDRADPLPIAQLFSQSYSSAFSYNREFQTRCWCTVKNKEVNNGRIRYKIISFSRISGRAEESRAEMTMNIDKPICADSQQYKLQNGTTLRPATGLDTQDLSRQPMRSHSRRLRAVINGNSDMKRVLFTLCKMAIKRNPAQAERLRSSIIVPDEPQRPPQAEEHRAPPEPSTIPPDQEGDPEASVSVETTRRCLVPTATAENEGMTAESMAGLQSAPAQEEESKNQNAAAMDVNATQSAIEKEVNSIRNSSFESYLPKSLNYANWGITAFLILALTFSTTQFFIYQNTLTQMYGLREMTEWARSRSIVSVYEATRSLTLIFPAADGLPLLSLAARADYDYSSIGYENKGTMNYWTWKLQDLKTFTDKLADIENKIQIHYIGVSAKQGLTTTVLKWIFWSPDSTQYYRNVQLHSQVSMLEDQSLAIYDKLTNNGAGVLANIQLALSNGLTAAINTSTNTITESLEVIQPVIDREKMVSLLLMCVMFASAGAFMMGFVPLLYSINRDTAHMLQLLTKTKTSSLKVQIENCAKFTSFLHFEGMGSQSHEEVERDEDDPVNDGTGLNESDKLVGRHKGRNRKGKNAIGFRGEFVSRIVKMLVVFALVNVYSLYCYYEPPSFFTKVNSHLEEVGNLETLMTLDYMLYTLMIEMFASNATYMGSTTVFAGLLSSVQTPLNNLQEHFLEFHRENENYFSSTYRAIFDSLVLNSACQTNVVDNLTECASMEETVLAKGLFLATGTYIDIMYRISSDYISKQQRTLNYTRSVLNSEAMIEVERLFRKYLMTVHQYVASAAIDSVDSALNSEWPISVLAFVLFLAVILVLYLLLWKLYVGVLKKDLFSTKLLYSYLPLEIIISNPQLAACVIEHARSLTAEMHS